MPILPVAHFSVAQISVAHFSVAHFTIYRTNRASWFRKTALTNINEEKPIVKNTPNFQQLDRKEVSRGREFSVIFNRHTVHLVQLMNKYADVRHGINTIYRVLSLCCGPYREIYAIMGT